MRFRKITAANLRRLKVAFTFDTGVDRGQEAAPPENRRKKEMPALAATPAAQQ